jgi:quercetin dioxygenase-like cupin family protein
MVVSYDCAKTSKPYYGVTRRILAHSASLMLTEHALERGAVLPEHSHAHEQLVYLLKGEIVLEMEGEQMNMVSGDSMVIAPNAKHKVTALTKSLALDIFTPARQDYL